MPVGTKLRNIRVDDTLWDAAREVAERREESVSEVLREALAQYVATHS